MMVILARSIIIIKLLCTVCDLQFTELQMLLTFSNQFLSLIFFSTTRTEATFGVIFCRIVF